MANEARAVQAHYGTPRLLERIIDALEKKGLDPAMISCGDLYPFDQLHGRGLAATQDHARHAGIRANMNVLDLGCGVGGCSRYLASVIGCRVTGVDLTEEYVNVARELAARCGLSDKIEVRQANALQLPFQNDTFDHVWSHNVTMNISDKVGLIREIARVLKSGGRFSCAELAQGVGGAPEFPVPWASDPSYSFLATPAEMRSSIEQGGLRILEQLDFTEANRAYVRENQARAARGEPPVQDNRVTMGDDFVVRVRNAGKATVEGKLVEQIVIAEKP